MTVQNEQQKTSNSPDSETVSVEIPKIKKEEDIPFRPASGYQNSSQDKLAKTDSLDDQITRFRYLTGRKVLYISMGAMLAAVLMNTALAYYEIENPLVENAFEVFKLIAMTVLGYLFGSKEK